MGFVEQFEHVFIGVQTKVYLRTDGRLGHRLAVVPCLLLHTTGRKTGEPRVCVLAYATDGDDLLVVASNNGGERPPAWLLNLQAQPEVNVQVARRHASATATAVFPGDDDFDRRWTIANDNNHQRYTKYQARTARPIPVVVITPRA